MKIVMRDGRGFEGTPVQIVEAMKSIAFGVESLSLAEYVGWVAQDALSYEGVELVVGGDSDADRCDSLVFGMIARGLAVRA